MKKFDLQFFAEDKITPGADPTPNTDPIPGQEGEKTFTQEELNKIISERLNKERIKHEKDTESKILEAAKVAQMSAEERFQHELKQREAAIREKELELQARDLRIKATDKLAEVGLPITLVNVLNYVSEESLNQGIEVLKDAFDKAVKVEVDKRLPSTNPQAGIPHKFEEASDPFLRGLKK